MSAIDNLPTLRDVITRYDLAAKKSLGQNFLLDLNLTMKIARSAGDLRKSTIIEVGPGPGGLTRALLASEAKKVIAIERDERFRDALAEISLAYPGKLEVIYDDALNIDYASLTASNEASSPTKIIANLPYNIATPLLVKWLLSDTGTQWYQSMTLMFQKEVAQRICALPGNKAYGRLAIIAAWKCHREIAFDVPPTAFVPPPKVMSSIVNLLPKASILACDPTKLERVTKAAFGQRRKMLRASLKNLGGQELLDKAGIEGTLRAEAIALEDFVALAKLI